MSTKPRVAIITRTKNRPAFLRRCLASVRAQTFQDWVHVIVNDAGEPAPVEQALAAHVAADPGRYVVLHRSQSVGMEAASNHGITHSDSELIVVLDDDDTWSPSFLAVMTQAWADRRVDDVRGVVCRSTRIVERVDGEVFIELGRTAYNDDLRHLSLFDLAASNRFAVNAFVFERAALMQIGSYRADLPVLGDWEFNLRFLRAFNIEVVPLTLAAFHVREASVTGAAGNTVSAGAELHYYYMNRLRNELLREDLAAGRLGLGTLMATAAAYQGTLEHLRKETRVLSPLNRLLKRIRGW